MKVDDLEIKEITFGQERELYTAYKKAYRNSDIDFSSGEVSNIKIDWDAHDMAVAMALDFAIEKPEEVLKNMSHPEIDALGQKILVKYLRVDDESKKI
jgi:hypothetical protein